MSLLESIRLALLQIRAQKLKSFFTLLGVTIGVMFLIAVVSIVEGMSQYVEKDFVGRFMGTNTFTLRRFPWYAEGTQAEWREWVRRPLLKPSDVQVVTSALPPDLRWAIDAQGQATASTQLGRPRPVEVHAVEGDFFTIRNYKLASGRPFTPQEMDLGTNVVVIGDEVAKFFFAGLDPVGRELRLGGLPYSVIGVIERQGTLFGMSLDKLAIAPFKSPLSRITNPRGDVGSLVVQASTPLMLEESIELTREVLRGHRRLRPSQPDNFVMETSASALVSFAKVKKVMTIAGSALPAIGLIVGGMVIMNIMLVAVAERTHEIGIRKSLGARRRDILSQFLVESATLSTMGAILGIVLGLTGAKIIESTTPLPAAVAPWSLIAATLLGTVVGIVSGVYPAKRASLLDPIEALRQE